jgi:hypothetical protein
VTEASAARPRPTLRTHLLEPAAAQHRLALYGLIVASGVVLWTVHAMSGPPVFPVDDAYITLHNARVLAGATDVNYAGVSAFVGATSVVHLLLVAALATVMPAAWALHAVMWLAVIGYALGLARLAFAFKASLLQALAFVVAGSLVAELPHQLLNGLETGLALAAMIWTLDCAAREHRVTASVLCGTLPFIRPELAAVGALVLATQAIMRWQNRNSTRWWLGVLRDCATAVAAALPWLLVLWAATGSPLPSSVSAKRYWFAEGCLDPTIKWHWVTDNTWNFIGMTGVLAASAILLTLTRLGRAGLIFIAALLVAYYREFPGALAHFDHRYLYVVLPFLLFAPASCFAASRSLIRHGATAIVAISAALGLVTIPAMWRRHTYYMEFTRDELSTVARWANDFIPAGSTVLVHDAGYIAAATNHTLIDVVGLKRPRSIDEHRRLTWPSCGRRRGEAIERIARETRPQFVIVLRDWNRLFRITPALRERGWNLQKVRSGGDAGYEVFKVSPPGEPTQ